MTDRTTAVGLVVLFVVAWSLTFAGGYHTVSAISSSETVTVELEVPENATATPTNETTVNGTETTPTNETTVNGTETTPTNETTVNGTNASISPWSPTVARLSSPGVATGDR
ncbi:MAG: hypothetical protein ABEJ78_06615 [Haloferacaceae archaeon]